MGVQEGRVPADADANAVAPGAAANGGGGHAGPSWVAITLAVIGLLTTVAGSGVLGAIVEGRSHPHDVGTLTDSLTYYRNAYERERATGLRVAQDLRSAENRAAAAEAQLQRIRRTLAAMLPSLPAGSADSAVLRLRLDSVSVHQDGESGTARWSFDVNADDRAAIPMPVQYFNDDDGATPIGRWVLLRSPAEGMLRLTVTGRRNEQLLRETTDVRIPASGGLIERKLRLQASDPDEGSFTFVFRLDRLN